MSGLQCSSITSALNSPHDVPAIATYSTSTMLSSSRQVTRTRPQLSFLSVFTSISYLLTFATTNTYPVDEQFLFVARISNNIDQLNGYLMTKSMKSVIKFMLTQQQTIPLLICRCYDKKISFFFKAMEAKLKNNHETCKHWDLMEHNNLSPGTKTIDRNCDVLPLSLEDLLN
jgi:hypothetical protein